MKQKIEIEKKIFSVRIPSYIFEKLEKYCKRFRLTKSKVINKLLFQFLK